MLAKTPPTPYYAVIFTTTRTEGDNGYAAMAQHMEELAKLQPGYLGIESAREETGITVSYWKDLESIKNANRRKELDNLFNFSMIYKFYFYKFRYINGHFFFIP